MEVLRTEIGGKEVSIENGRMAKQAAGSVVVRCGDTMVLCTTCFSKDVREGQSFFPLVVDFQEKTYAAGKIPGGFFKREGRLSESEILTSRLIDRPIRPLFPEGFMNEVQVTCTVISAGSTCDADVLALVGSSAALSISGLPFDGPVAAVRLGRVNGKFVVNDPKKELDKNSDMNILIAGTEKSVVMVEGDCDEVSEKEMVEALFFAHEHMQPLIKLQKELKEKVGKSTIEWTAPSLLEDVKTWTKENYTKMLDEALQIKVKLERYDRKDSIKKEALEAAKEKFADHEEQSLVASSVAGALEEMAYDLMRKRIINTKTRIDGRDLTTVRPIDIEVGVLPRAHGSCLFTRGETQALVSCTLGSADESQKIDALLGAYEKHFLLHYNFPPFSVGEVKMLRGPSRRDVGHGNLSEGALSRRIPSEKDFPYTIRIVSDVLESNGSSSMATVCGGALALMDAGVPNIKPVAGIAMGLIAEDDQMEVLTDILGDEDHLGDMDFKVTGTADGITGFQLDTKISGISVELMERALNQAKDARIHILEKMTEVLGKSRQELSAYAPKMKQVTVRQSKIKDVIGPGGKNIKSVVEATGAKVDINDDGTVKIFAPDEEMLQKAVEMVEALSGDVEVGRIYDGVVRKVVDFGAFINIAPNTDGLCHISELAEERVRRTEDILKEGDNCRVKVLEIDRQGRIRLSLKAAQAEDKQDIAK